MGRLDGRASPESPPEQALNRPLTEVIPDLGAAASWRPFENVLARGTVEVLAPALHHYLIRLPAAPSDVGRLRRACSSTSRSVRCATTARIVGVVVTVEDVTARVEQERQLAARLLDAGHGRRRHSDGSASRHVEALTRLMAQDDWRVRRAAVSTLAAAR